MLGIPEIVQLTGICLGDNEVSFMLEPLDGSLFGLFQILSLEERRSLFIRLMHDLIVGVTTLNSCNINHLDIKSANILYRRTPSWKFKLSDFGISRLYVKGIKDIDVTLVTMTHRSPELLSEHARSTMSFEKVDVWSIGVTLYEFLTNSNMIFTDNPAIMLSIMAGRLGISSEKLKSGKYHGRLPIGNRLDLSWLPNLHREVFLSMFEVNPMDRPSAKQLANVLSLAITPPRLIPEFGQSPNGSVQNRPDHVWYPEFGRRDNIKIHEFITELGSTNVNYIHTVVFIEIMTRCLAYSVGTVQCKYLYAASHIAGLYLEDYPKFTFCLKPDEILDMRAAEREILIILGFEIYNSRLTARLNHLSLKFEYSQDKIYDYLRTLPDGYFSQPVDLWFSELGQNLVPR
jgi:serine/threonine protein kinase